MKQEFDAASAAMDIAQLSTDSDELRKRFMDPCRLGSEAEWWARRRIEELEQQLAESKEEYGRACHLVAQMHFAATGEVTGPKLGVVEDVAEVRRQLAEARAETAHVKEVEFPRKIKAVVAGWDTKIANLEKQVADLTQTSFDLCPECGWRTLIPGEGCLKCSAASRDVEINLLRDAVLSAKGMVGHPDNIAILDRVLAATEPKP